MKRTLIIAAIGWAGIVALGWWLADQRMHCYCDVRLTAVRDNWLLLGLSVALVGACAVSLITGRRASRVIDASPTPRTANRAERSKLLR